jgi:hypothetical protein
MMAQEELEISIDAHGRVTVRTIGIKGPRCLDVAEAVALILGREESRQLTSEYYEAQQTTQSHIDVRHSH